MNSLESSNDKLRELQKGARLLQARLGYELAPSALPRSLSELRDASQSLSRKFPGVRQSSSGGAQQDWLDFKLIPNAKARSASDRIKARLEEVQAANLKSLKETIARRELEAVKSKADAQIDALIAKGRQELLDQLTSTRPETQSPLTSERSQRYAKAVLAYNEARAVRRDGTPFSLAGRFSECLEPSDEIILRDYWRLIEMTCTSKEDCALPFLEAVYLEHIERGLQEAPRDALSGGRPLVVERAKAYTRLLVSRQFPPETHLEWDTLEGQEAVPIFLLLYVLVRAGQWREAVGVASSCERATSLLSALTDRNSPQPLLQAEYAQRQLLGEATQDPFRMILLCVLGRVEQKSGQYNPIVIQTIEDWLWLQLYTVKKEVLKGSILSLGPSHFSTPLVYVEALFVTGQWERGLAKLHGILHSDSIHMTIALAQAGLLKTNPSDVIEGSGDDQGSFLSTRPSVSLHLRKMLTRYARVLMPSDRSLAMYYALLMAQLTSTRLEPEILLPFIGDDVELWFGKIRADGVRQSGRLDQPVFKGLLLSEAGKDPVETLIEASANNTALEPSQRIHLLSLAGRWDTILECLIEAILGSPTLLPVAYKPERASSWEEEAASNLLAGVLDFMRLTGKDVGYASLKLESETLLTVRSFAKACRASNWEDAVRTATDAFFDFDSLTIKLPASLQKRTPNLTISLVFTLMDALKQGFEGCRRYGSSLDAARQSWMRSASQRAHRLLLLVAKPENQIHLTRDQLASLTRTANLII